MQTLVSIRAFVSRMLLEAVTFVFEVIIFCHSLRPVSVRLTLTLALTHGFKPVCGVEGAFNLASKIQGNFVSKRLHGIDLLLCASN